jgi:hypothetical protein
MQCFSGFCQQSGKTILSTSESSPEPGTDLGALSVGSSGGNLKPAQEQSRRDMSAREIFFTINQYAPGGPLDVKAGNIPTIRYLRIPKRYNSCELVVAMKSPRKSKARAPGGREQSTPKLRQLFSPVCIRTERPFWMRAIRRSSCSWRRHDARTCRQNRQKRNQ